MAKKGREANPYEGGGRGGWGYESPKKRWQHLDNEFQALILKSEDELRDILEQQEKVFQREKNLLDEMVQAVKDEGKKVPKKMSIDFNLPQVEQDKVQDNVEGYATVICNNNKNIDKMVRARADLAVKFPVVKDAARPGGAPDEEREGRPRGEKVSKVEKQARDMAQFVINWYHQRVEEMKRGEEVDENASNEIRNFESDEENKRLVGLKTWAEMAEAKKAMEKAIKEREAAELKKESGKILEKLKQFLETIGKRPPEGEAMATVTQRLAAWNELNQEAQGALNRTQAAGAEVQRDSKVEVDEINDLRERKVPEALASAALGVTRGLIDNAKLTLESTKTLDDLLSKIKEYKTKVEGREVVLPPNELITDEDIDEWLFNLTRAAQNEAGAALQYMQVQQLRRPDGQMVFIAEHPNFKDNAENLEKALNVLHNLIDKKSKELKEAKHRVRVREAVTSEAAQKGGAKRAGMFPERPDEEAKRIDIDEVKKNEVWGQLVNVLLREQTFLGREKGVGGEAERRVNASEQTVINELIHQFGPESPYQLTAVQCGDLFYAAKAWLYEKAAVASTGEPRQAMPEAAEAGGARAGAAPAEAAPAKSGWKTTLLKALGWGGAGVGITVAAGMGGLPIWAGVAAVGGLRAIDNIRHHVIQHRALNRWKKERQDDKNFKSSLEDHLSFTIANLRENNLRHADGHLEYADYFENIHQHLAHENERREKPLSTAELDKTAAAFAVFYDMDDQIERERMGAELNRSPNSRRWWTFIDQTIGSAVRGGRLGKGWQVSSAGRRTLQGSYWMGVSFGLYAVAREIPGVRETLRAVAGWKIGGAIVDRWAGKRAPENVVETQLTQLEGTLSRLPEMNLPALSAQLQALADCRSALNQISNPVEYARQKERFKEILMATLAEKMLKEEPVFELATPEARREAMRGKGKEITGEVARAYSAAVKSGKEQEKRLEKWRLAGRVAGALGMVGLGYVAEAVIQRAPGWWHDLFGEKHIYRPAEAAVAAAPRGPEVLPEPSEMPPVEIPEPAPPVLAVVDSDAVVHKGEGVEHALKRQLMADPEKWGYDESKGNLNRWAGRQAHEISRELGYVKGGGEEVRVRLIDKVAYVLDKDSSGRAVVDEVRVHKMPDGAFMPDQPIAGGTSSQLDEYEYGYKKPSGPAVVEVESAPVREPEVDGGAVAPPETATVPEQPVVVTASPDVEKLTMSNGAEPKEAAATEPAAGIKTEEQVPPAQEAPAGEVPVKAEAGSATAEPAPVTATTEALAAPEVRISLDDGSSIDFFKDSAGKVTIKVDPSSQLLEKYQNNLSAEPWFKEDVNPRESVPSTRLNLFENRAPGRLAKMELYVDALQDKQVSDNNVLQKAVKDILALNIRNFTTFSGHTKPDELFTEEVLKQAGLK